MCTTKKRSAINPVSKLLRNAQEKKRLDGCPKKAVLLDDIILRTLLADVRCGTYYIRIIKPNGCLAHCKLATVACDSFCVFLFPQ